MSHITSRGGPPGCKALRWGRRVGWSEGGQEGTGQIVQAAAKRGGSPVFQPRLRLPGPRKGSKLGLYAKFPLQSPSRPLLLHQALTLSSSPPSCSCSPLTSSSSPRLGLAEPKDFWHQEWIFLGAHDTQSQLRAFSLGLAQSPTDLPAYPKSWSQTLWGGGPVYPLAGALSHPVGQQEEQVSSISSRSIVDALPLPCHTPLPGPSHPTLS